jgi:ribosomal protein S18 acetylase RimI-like enzyme
MQIFSNPHVTIAGIADIPAITRLLNRAYRGETSKQGWTTEAHLIAGETRTDEANVKQVMEQAGSVFLKYTNEGQQIIGCVNLQHHGNKLYLGMFSVAPGLQGSGIGKQLLQSAEAYATQLHCVSIYLSVISVRTELIQWYQRHGYYDTGERKFFNEDDLTGKHLQPLEFMTMEKVLQP